MSPGGTRRFAAVLARTYPAPPAPPGVDAERFRLALLEDTYEVVSGLELVTAALALCPARQPAAEALTWPGTPVLRIEPADDPTETRAGLTACAALGATEAAVVCADAPDLPRLLVGKLFRALGSAAVAVCPSTDGSLVALAARLPVPQWLAGVPVGLDTPDAVAALAAVAPARRDVALGPGWHRIRTGADLGTLDPNLEGWDTTRALLASRPR